MNNEIKRIAERIVRGEYATAEDVDKLAQAYLQEREWISVGERLPETWIEVLVAVCPPMQMNEVHMAYLDKKGNFIVTNISGNAADFITHWMPLPEPPKETE